MDVTVAIPTYGRNRVLVNTISNLIDLELRAAHILVMDQTLQHNSIAEDKLTEWDKSKKIRWIRLKKPSITASMNLALCIASSPIVLFVDDDIIPAPGLIGVHATAYQDSKEIWAVVGQVLQPGQEPVVEPGSHTKDGLFAFLDFRFCSTSRAWVKSAMAGNFSVCREKALKIGGFDENFLGVAYRFETEFCRRIWQHGGKVLFEPAASIRHLRETRGGTRRFGDHRSSLSPSHGVGDYYFALRNGITVETIKYMIKRPFRETYTRFHLKNPWYIPVKWLGELGAFFWAIYLFSRGPKYIKFSQESSKNVQIE